MSTPIWQLCKPSSLPSQLQDIDIGSIQGELTDWAKLSHEDPSLVIWTWLRATQAQELLQSTQSEIGFWMSKISFVRFFLYILKGLLLIK